MHTHLLNILATWRITRLLMIERAPYASLDRLREYVEDRRYLIAKEAIATYDKASDIPKYSIWHEISEALRCEFCLSIWIGFALAIVTRQNVLYGFAYSAGALLFGRIFEWFDRQ